jgi:hypothetical protein
VNIDTETGSAGDTNESYYILQGGGGEEKTITGYVIPQPFPLVIMVKVGRR